MLDSALHFEKQISSVGKDSFFHFRLIAILNPFLSPKDLVTVILFRLL